MSEVSVQYRGSTYFSEDDAPEQHFVGILVTTPATRFHEFLAGPFATKDQAAAVLAGITNDPRGIYQAELEIGRALGRDGDQDQFHVVVAWRDGETRHAHRLLGPFGQAEAAEAAVEKLMKSSAAVQEVAHV